MDKGVKGYLALLLFICAAVFHGGCAADEPAAQAADEIYLELGPEGSGRDTEALRERRLEEDAKEEVDLLMEEAGQFAYDSLTKMQQLWYRDIEKSLGSMAEFTRLSEEGLAAGLDESCIDIIFQCVMSDHPEIFYVDGYSYSKYMRGDDVVAISFSGSFDVEPGEAVFRKKMVEAYAQELLEGLAEDASDYDKVKYVYETLILNTDYDLDAPDNQNIYSVLVNRASVCLGYAKATQYLLNRLGIECTLVQGNVDTGEGHAWNLVKVDGSYYYLDTTWGDASYQAAEGAQGEEGYQPSINYDYLCVTTEQLLRTHTLGNVAPMPECTDMAANYYVREDLLFTFYDRDKMALIFGQAREQGKKDVTVKCADAECFLLIKEALIDGQEIFEYMPEGDTVAFACNDKQLSLTFWTN